MKFYEIRQPAIWGDYGNILFGGMTQRLGRRNAKLQLERTGPFIPPISFTGFDLLVTEEMREELAASNLAKIEFRPVIKKRIALLHWEKWDRSRDIPSEYDFTIEEPEDFVLKFPHSEEASRKMGDVYEVILPKCCRCEDQGYDAETDCLKWSLDITDWDGSHIFLAKAPGDYVLFVSEIGKRWIEKHAEGWLKFGLAETRS
jgi:hypothetical protein